MRMVMLSGTMAMGVWKRARYRALQEQIESHSRNKDSGKHGEKGISLLRQNVFLSIKRHRAEEIHTRGMRGGHDESEQKRVPGRTSRSDEVCGDNRLAVSWFERMKGSEARSNNGCDE